MAAKQSIENLTSQVRRLLDEHAQMSAACRAAEAENAALRSDNTRLQSENLGLQAQLRTARLGEGLSAGGDTAAARARINLLLREVDKCIALVNKQN